MAAASSNDACRWLLDHESVVDLTSPPPTKHTIINPYSANKVKQQQQQRQEQKVMTTSRDTTNQCSAPPSPMRQRVEQQPQPQPPQQNQQQQPQPQNQPQHPQQQQKLPSVPMLEFPMDVVPYYRFFGSLLRSTPLEFVEAAMFDLSARQLWDSICQRVGLSHMIPLTPMASCYPNATMHFGIRAALVLEESRHAISTALSHE
jgi:hypothetical protein